jgi:hypothetical protein
METATPSAFKKKFGRALGSTVAHRTPLVRELVSNAYKGLSASAFTVPPLTRLQEAREYACLLRERATLNCRISQLEANGHRPPPAHA